MLCCTVALGVVAVLSPSDRPSAHSMELLQLSIRSGGGARRERDVGGGGEVAQRGGPGAAVDSDGGEGHRQRGPGAGAPVAGASERATHATAAELASAWRMQQQRRPSW